jgi:hypothetical protein
MKKDAKKEEAKSKIKKELPTGTEVFQKPANFGRPPKMP